jgi:endonuclease/exonuclease/phosphatase family metal-dependent hydrolase
MVVNSTPTTTRYHRTLVGTAVPESRLRNTRLNGHLTPPKAGGPPKGVKVERRADGTRVLTLNVHAGVPASLDRRPSHESIAGVRDIARYINGVNPDVVIMQELRDHGPGTGVPYEATYLKKLIHASDMAYTTLDPHTHMRNANAIFTRHHYKLGKVINADLSAKGDPATNRVLGVANVIKPNGHNFTTAFTHLSHMNTLGAAKRRFTQMREIGTILRHIERTGSFTYHVPGQRKERTAKGFNGNKIIFGGDLNTTRQGRYMKLDSADQMMAYAHLKHANRLARGHQAKAGIDHLYSRGFKVQATWKAAVPRHELRFSRPTDHEGFVADYF